MVELDGMIYVLGGENKETELVTMEMFNPYLKTWKLLTSMTMVRKVRNQNIPLTMQTIKVHKQ